MLWSSLTGRSMCPTSLGLMAALAAAAPTAAGPCDPQTINRVRHVYRISVERGTAEFVSRLPLVLPLASPRIVTVPVARFFVVVDPPEPIRPSGPLDLGGALAGAYEAAARDPDKITERLYTPGTPERQSFEAACRAGVDAVLARENMRIQSTEFGAKSDEGGLAGYTVVHTCSVTDENGRAMAARVYFKRETRSFQRMEDRAGTLAATLKLEWIGKVEAVPTLKIQLRAPGLEVKAEEVSNVPETAVNARLAQLRPALGEEARRAAIGLQDGTYSLSEEEQQTLCTGDGGRVTHTIPFEFARTAHELPVVLAAQRAREVAGALGEEPAACRRINCDCGNLDFGLLTGAYRQECRAAEASLKRACADTGVVTWTCHQTASGPNPWP
jgi:hypothetical protein